MALPSGVMSLTIEYAKDLKDRDWFCRMDPYCIIQVGSQVVRSRTHASGGRNPVWNQTFQFNIINENTASIEIKDEDVGRDGYIGSATLTLTKAREQGPDHMQVPVTSKRSHKQHGFISVALRWTPNAAVGRPLTPAGPITLLTPSAPAYAAPPPPPPTYTAAPPIFVPAPAPQPVVVMPPPPPPAAIYCPGPVPVAVPMHHHHFGHHHFGHHHHGHGLHVELGFGHHHHHHRHHGHHHHHHHCSDILIFD